MTRRGWLPTTGPMKVPADVNVVRFTGFGGGAFVGTPRGFVRAELRGDSRQYAVREGYRLERCLGELHRGPPHKGACRACAPMYGVVAVKIPEDGAVLPEHRAKSSGRLATPERNHACDHCKATGNAPAPDPGMVRTSCPNCGGLGQLSGTKAPIPLWDSLDRILAKNSRPPMSDDRSIRKRLSKARHAGLIGRKS